MAKYLFLGSYTPQGVNGLVKDGGTGRRAAVDQMAQGLGGTVDAFYYGFGETDVYVIADLPDDATALALSLAVTSTGTVTLRTVPLHTPEELDAAASKSVNYRAPGA